MSGQAVEVDLLYTESAGTNCSIGGRRGIVTYVVREGTDRNRRAVAAFVSLDGPDKPYSGPMLHVILGDTVGSRGTFHEVQSAREITRDEFDRINEIDTMRNEWGWRDPAATS